jgi:hypothetical protein
MARYMLHTEKIGYRPSGRAFTKPYRFSGRMAYHTDPENALLNHITAAHHGVVDAACRACREIEVKYGRGKVATDGI